MSPLCATSKLVLITLLLNLLPLTLALDAAGWRKQSIYQLLTDRFSNDAGTNATCVLKDNVYCGGTWNGITNHLDYIQDLGFTAVWISPIVENAPGGYHGYYQMNQRSFNLEFGTEADLIALSTALHARGMYLMIDVVANHLGIPGQDSLETFPQYDAYSSNPNVYKTGASFDPTSGLYGAYNKTSMFHMDPYCVISNYDNVTDTEDCWFYDNLPDLDQSVPSVKAELYDWIDWLVKAVGADGMRIDTVMEVDIDFWGGFQSSAGVFAIGEVDNGNPSILAPYQSSTVLTSTLNYPTYWPLWRGFQSGSGDLTALGSMIYQMQDAMEDVTVLGTFLDNHDNARFASLTTDTSLRKNALAFSLLSDGIPIMYAGGEQGYDGVTDPYCREPVWWSGFDTGSEMYTFVKPVMGARGLVMSNSTYDFANAKTVVLHNTEQDIIIYRAPILSAFTNRGASQPNDVEITVIIPDLTGGEVLTDALTGDLVDVSSCGSVVVTLSGGMPVVLVPEGTSLFD